MPDGFIGADTSSYRAGHAPNMLEQAAGWGQVANQGLAYQTGQIELAQKKIGLLSNAAKSILGLPNPTVQDAGRVMYGLVKMGAMDPQDFARESANAAAAAAADPQNGLRNWASQHAMMLDNASAAIAARYGTPVQSDYGDRKVWQNVNPVQNSVGPMGGAGASVANGLTPGEATAPTNMGVTPAGAPIVGTRAQFLRKAGAPIPASAPAAAPAPTPDMPGQMGAAVRGYRPGDVQSAPVAPPAPTAQAGGGNGIVMDLTPGEKQARTITGENSGRQLSGAQNEASSYQQRVMPLEKSIDALEKLGATGTGPGTETVNQIKSFLVSSGMPGVDVDKIKNFDEAKKYLTQYAMSQGGAGTNDKLAAAFSGNPSTTISNAAASDVAKSALALERMKQAQLTAFQKSGLPESEFAKFSSQWNPSQDARAYGFDLMSGAQQKKLLDGMKPDEKAKFVASLKAAHEAGLLKRPQ